MHRFGNMFCSVSISTSTQLVSLLLHLGRLQIICNCFLMDYLNNLHTSFAGNTLTTFSFLQKHMYDIASRTASFCRDSSSTGTQDTNIHTGAHKRDVLLPYTKHNPWCLSLIPMKNYLSVEGVSIPDTIKKQQFRFHFQHESLRSFPGHTFKQELWKFSFICTHIYSTIHIYSESKR